MRQISPFWQALLLWVGCGLALEFAVYPLMPRSLLIQYMVILAVGLLLYYSADDQRWQAFLAPLRALVVSPRLGWLRVLLLVVIPLGGGALTYVVLQPTHQAPLELRQAHPAPPSSFNAWGKRIELNGLDNPIRAEFSQQWQQDPEGALGVYREAVEQGRDHYFNRCVFCHGALLDGQGHLGLGLNPAPANFRDIGTIAQLEESYLFWRIATGGPGLPREGAPSRSAMPAWHETMDERQVWQTILFLFDAVQQEPRIWDPERSSVASAIRQRVAAERANLEGEKLYQLHCASCHGEEGLGDGVAADKLYPRPRDFGLGLFKYKRSPGAAPPRDEDLVEIIANGLAGTSMPAWKGLLSEQQIRSLVPVIKGFDYVGTWAPEDAEESDFDEQGRYRGNQWLIVEDEEPVAGRVAYSPESVALGRKQYEATCQECHGEQGRGNILSDKPLEDDWGYRVWPRDLTKPLSWRASEETGSDARDKTIARLYQRISIGISGTPMPAHREVEAGNKDPLSLADRWHVANYIYSLRATDLPLAPDALVRGHRIDGALPDNGADPRWQQARAVALPLAPNLMVEERLYTPLNTSVEVRALFNAEQIAFLIEWNDRTDSRPGAETAERLQDAALTLSPDALALQFPRAVLPGTGSPQDKPLLRHGDPRHRVALWYWNAGRVSPPLPQAVNSFEGHGLQSPLRPGSSAPGLSAQGQWDAGRWQLVIRADRESPGLAFREGEYLPFSLANWDGSNGEAGSRHTLTGWHQLLLPETLSAARLYGVPVGVMLILLLLMLWLNRKTDRP
ncbi:c-type cytochrome [Aestuariirhabdus sp. LZHN29]|uniref:c-type cytochrome n=1 Tax=Aestuariirhabdus sp. LZHN29 TaxID=3417462 RepID=UPI003CEAA7AC